MVLIPPIPAWDDVEFVENGELGSRSVLNRPTITLNNKSEWLRSVVTVLETSASCLAEKLGEELGVDCSSGSCVPCWGSPTNFLTNDTYYDAISKIDVQLGLTKDSVVSLALAESVFVTYTGLSTDSPVSVFSGTDYIDNLPHRDALVTLDSVAKLHADSIVSQTSNLSLHTSSLNAHSSSITSVATSAASLTSAASTLGSVQVAVSTLVSSIDSNIDNVISPSLTDVVSTVTDISSIVECIVSEISACGGS